MNTEEEYRGDYLVTESQKKLWAVELDLAKKLLEVCERHDLKIWAAAGTLLGAVRHMGFIPWDDDMDFVMMRDDYDKLLSYHAEFNEPYFLQSAHTERGYSRGHAQLRNSNTAAILPSDIWQKFNQGAFIDIFVMDLMPDDPSEWVEPIRAIKARQIEMRKRTYGSFASLSPRSCWEMIKTVWRFRNESLYDYFIETENIVRSLPKGKEGKWVDAMFCVNPEKAPARLERWYSDTVWLPFEDIKLPAPIDFDSDLKMQYGENYMTPLRVSTMHGEIIIDAEHSYEEKLKELRRKAPLKEKLRHFFMPSY